MAKKITLSQLLSWCELTGTVKLHHSFFIISNNRSVKTFYFCAIVNNKEISMNYRIHGRQYRMMSATVVTRDNKVTHYRTVKKLLEELEV